MTPPSAGPTAASDDALLGSDAAVRARLHAIAQAALHRDAPLPEGPLDEALDSMDRLTLVVAIEDAFDVAFDEADDADLVTLDDVVALIRRKRA
jgi:acyl carrier protein